LEWWIAAVPLDELEQWTASRRQELLPRARPVPAASREREAQLRVLRRLAQELLFRLLGRALEARLCEQ